MSPNFTRCVVKKKMLQITNYLINWSCVQYECMFQSMCVLYMYTKDIAHKQKESTVLIYFKHIYSEHNLYFSTISIIIQEDNVIHFIHGFVNNLKIVQFHCKSKFTHMVLYWKKIKHGGEWNTVKESEHKLTL